MHLRLIGELRFQGPVLSNDKARAALVRRQKFSPGRLLWRRCVANVGGGGLPVCRLVVSI